MTHGNLTVQSISEPLYRAKGWIMFAGVMSIIQGVFTILSIWGIIICWIPIWMCAILCSVSNHLKIAFETENEHELHASMGKLATYFRVFGILAAVMIAFAVIGLVAALAIPAFVRARHAAMGQ